MGFLYSDIVVDGQYTVSKLPGYSALTTTSQFSLMARTNVFIERVNTIG